MHRIAGPGSKTRVYPIGKEKFMNRKSMRRSAAVALPLLLATTVGAAAQGLKSYDSSKPSFWAHPPPDWFLGDETDRKSVV